uniref:Uncharacterized protein n=1 Tax=Rhizophora mucronata TaxID=61149 RepID=A0A2P2NUQ3_RHIMU
MPDIPGRDEIPCEPVHRSYLRPLLHPTVARQRQQHVSSHHAGPPQQGLCSEPHIAAPHPDVVRVRPAAGGPRPS